MMEEGYFGVRNLSKDVTGKSYLLCPEAENFTYTPSESGRLPSYNLAYGISGYNINGVSGLVTEPQSALRPEKIMCPSQVIALGERPKGYEFSGSTYIFTVSNLPGYSATGSVMVGFVHGSKANHLYTDAHVGQNPLSQFYATNNYSQAIRIWRANFDPFFRN